MTYDGFIKSYVAITRHIRNIRRMTTEIADMNRQALDARDKSYANLWMYEAGTDWAEFYRRPGRFPRDE